MKLGLMPLVLKRIHPTAKYFHFAQQGTMNQWNLCEGGFIHLQTVLLLPKLLSMEVGVLQKQRSAIPSHYSLDRRME